MRRLVRRSKYIHINPRNPQATAVCDRTGFFVMHNDLVKEKERVGYSNRWNGLLVHKNFVDKPNLALSAPKIKNDPKPVHMPRPSPYKDFK